MKRILYLSLVVVVLASAFWLVDFRMVRASTAQDSQIASSYQGGQTSSPPIVNLRVEGNGALERMLQARLAESLAGKPGFRTIRQPGETAIEPGSAIISLVLKRNEVFWTPFYAKAEIEVEVAYATNGDLSFQEQDPPHFRSSSDQPAFQLSGRFAIADVAWGLMSLPGYQSYLAQQIDKAVVAGLEEQMKGKVS